MESPAVWLHNKPNTQKPVITPWGLTFLPTQEAKYGFSGLVAANKQTKNKKAATM